MRFEFRQRINKMTQQNAQPSLGTLGTLVHCTMPWVVNSRHDDTKLFFGPKHNIYDFFMILFGLFDLILLSVCQICHVNCETEN